MAANEISERLAAAAWVQCGAVDGGEGIAQFSAANLRYRSYVGFQNRIITTVNVADAPLVILPLDRVMSRKEAAVFAVRHGTVGPTQSDLSRPSYPIFEAAQASYPNVFAQPIHLDWMGANLASPTFYPMGLPPGPTAVPLGFDMDLFNAIAVLLPALAAVGQAGDFSVLVLKHAKIEGSTTVEQVLPAA